MYDDMFHVPMSLKTADENILFFTNKLKNRSGSKITEYEVLAFSFIL